MSEHKTAEEYFQDRDAFLHYVHTVVNPAREKEELEICKTPGLPAHLFDVISERRYRQQKEPNA